MLRGPKEIPLDRDVAARTLPWIVAVMVFLATLALAGTLMLDSVIARWSGSLAGTLTVQVPAAASPEETERRVQQIVTIVSATAGVQRVRVLSRGEVQALLDPWLGRNTAGLGLPLPRLVDVGTVPGARLDLAALRTLIAAKVPGTVIEEHQKWLDELLGVTRWARWLALGILLLIVFAAAATVVLATRTSLRIHRGITEVLHLIGARDEYIAGQFQRHAFRLTFMGGLAGCALAVLTLFAFERLTGRLHAVPGIQLSLGLWHWLALAIVPLAAGALAAVAARYTVLRSLARMS